MDIKGAIMNDGTMITSSFGTHSVKTELVPQILYSFLVIGRQTSFKTFHASLTNCSIWFLSFRNLNLSFITVHFLIFKNIQKLLSFLFYFEINKNLFSKFLILLIIISINIIIINSLF